MSSKSSLDFGSFAVHREAYPEVPPRVEYSLTEKGRTLSPILKSLRKRGEEYAVDILKNK
nr:winged helix-turn-helix transcriptional regulator [Halobacteriovorax sp. HLS]